MPDTKMVLKTTAERLSEQAQIDNTNEALRSQIVAHLSQRERTRKRALCVRDAVRNLEDLDRAFHPEVQLTPNQVSALKRLIGHLSIAFGGLDKALSDWSAA